MIPKSDRKKLKGIAKNLPEIYDTFMENGEVKRKKETRLVFGHQILRADPKAEVDGKPVRPNKKYNYTYDKRKDHLKELEARYAKGEWEEVGKYINLVTSGVGQDQSKSSINSGMHDKSNLNQISDGIF